MTVKISLNKRTLRELTSTEELLISGGYDTSGDDQSDPIFDPIEIPGDDGFDLKGKGTFDTECKCPSQAKCPATKKRNKKTCDASD